MTTCAYDTVCNALRQGGDKEVTVTETMLGFEDHVVNGIDIVLRNFDFIQNDKDSKREFLIYYLKCFHSKMPCSFINQLYLLL